MQYIDDFDVATTDYNELRLEPIGPIAIIAHTSNQEFARKVSNVLYEKRLKRYETNANPYVNNPGYLRTNYLWDSSLTRFQTGEGKFQLADSVRGHDVFIITDVLSYNANIKICGYDHIASPDDHYRDLLRIVSACAGKAKRINVIMPFVYEGLQVKKDISSQESLDCSAALKQLYSLGVTNLIVFDPHDGRIDNSVPLLGIEMPNSAYKMITTLFNRFGSLKIDPEHTMVVSPDETGVKRAIFYSSMLNLPLGIFYRQKDYSVSVDGDHPIKEYRFLGDDVEGKDVMIIDDMINTCNTMLITANKLKERGAKDIYCLAPFGLFNDGLGKFDEAYESGLIKACVCTNLIYRPQELLNREWFVDVNMTPYVARIIDALNVDESIGKLINSTKRITDFLDQVRIDEILE